MTARRRVVVLIALAVLLAAAFAIDRIERPAAERDDAVAVAALMPSASPLRSLASTWFCPGGTGTAGDFADVTVVAANPTPADIAAVATVVGTEGDPITQAFTIPAHGHNTVRLADLVTAPYLAATIDVEAGGVVVEQQVMGSRGRTVGPCASSGAERWYLADGSTAREDTMLLSLYNPFPEDAIVDLSFSTDQGRAVPSNFQGLVVKGGRLVVVNVGDHVRRRNRVAATVATRRGRVVANRLQVRGGAVRGLSSALAAPSPGEEWWFAEGFAGDGIGERFSVYNPGTKDAAVTIDLVLSEGAAEPFDVTVPARSRVDVSINDEERVPKNVAHSAIVRTTNGVPVIAERAITASAPSARAGSSEALGARRTAARWLFAAGAATDAIDEWVSVVNVGATPVTVTITALAAGQPLGVEGLQDVAIAAGARRSFRLTEVIKREDLPLLVEATGGEVVAERALYYVGSSGIALSAGVPLR